MFLWFLLFLRVLSIIRTGFLLATAFDELHETFQCSFTVVVDDGIVALLVVFQCWERCDFGVFQFIGSGIDFGDDN